MTHKPSSEEMMQGVTRFLETQILSTLTDRGLAFRLKIALYLIELTQRDQRTFADRIAAQWHRLANLLHVPETIPANTEQIVEGLTHMNAELVNRIREGEYSGLNAEKDHILATLREELSIVQPRFDLNFDCETASAGEE